MLYLDPSAPAILVAKANHLRFMKCFINKKLGQPRCGNKVCEICDSSIEPVNPIKPEILQFLLKANHISDILVGSPDTLQKISFLFWQTMFPKMSLVKLVPYFKKIDAKPLGKKDKAFQDNYKLINPYVKQLNSIFNYHWFNNKFSKFYNSYQLCKSLDRYTCTYCNRSYTSTVFTDKKELVTRPTLDHWFPQSKFPLLAISFHNLIPSCYSCNSSIKGSGVQLLNKYTHPYVDSNQSDDFEFDYTYTSLKGFRIFVKDTSNGRSNGFKAKNSVESMYIDEVYNSNISELRDMILIQRNYSLGYIEKMQKLLKTNMSKEEVYRLLFGVMYSQKDYHKRPLSKFKKDILKKLGMLNDM